jgi:ATP-binding cassette subfamily B multidrug efflux pump
VSPYRALWRYVWRHRWRYIAGSGCLLGASGLSLAIPWTVKNAIEALSTAGGEAPLARYVAVIVLLAVGHAAVRLGSRFALLGGGQRVEYDLRNDLYAALQSLPPAFYQSRRTGDLMARASSDIGAVKSLVGFGAVSLIGTVFAFVGTLAAMLAIDPWLTLWALGPYPLLVGLAKQFNTLVHARTQALQEQLGTLSAKVQENLSGMSVVRAYTLEPAEMAAFGRLNVEYLRRSIALARVQAQFAPLMGLITGIGMLVILWVGGQGVMEGRLTLGALVAFSGYLAHLAWPALALGWTVSVARRGLTSMMRIQEILESAPTRTGSSAGGSFAITRGALEFRHLGFAYDDRPPVLHDVSFSVEAGEFVALVGPTGSGKSTLAALVGRLREPPPGTVLIDGRDVLTIDLTTLRRALGYVPQEAFLFSRSILDNIEFAAGDARQVASDQAREVASGRAREFAAGDGREPGGQACVPSSGTGRTEAADAARTAGLLGEIEALPQGWDTVVGERGLTLSGGQRQRAALARALRVDPPLLVLDDVFASVDVTKEVEILDGLRRARAGRTTLLITHRLRACQEADRVVVLVEGRVVEEGAHAELLERGAIYARLWRVQQLEDEIARA